MGLRDRSTGWNFEIGLSYATPGSIVYHGPMGRGANYTGTTAYQRQRDALRRRAARYREPCCFCGGEIDYSLRHPDPWAFSADHAQPVSKGGAVSGSRAVLRPCHLRCNMVAGNRWGTEADGALPAPASVTVYDVPGLNL